VKTSEGPWQGHVTFAVLHDGVEMIVQAWIDGTHLTSTGTHLTSTGA
jgi:hypothetical protein